MWWTFAVAGATPIDDARTQALLEAVVPLVEQRTGRVLVRVPAAAVATRDELYPRLLAPSGLSAARDVGTWIPGPELRRQVAEILDHAVAVYVPQSEQVVVVKEVLVDVQGSLGLEDEGIEPLVQCVLAHELVHAVQHQYGVEASGPQGLQRGQRALREGHASLVAAEVCETVHGEPVARLMDVVQSIELEASLAPEDEAAVYGWGRRLAETLDAEGLLWPALHAPAPHWDDIVDAVVPSLAPAWRVPDPLSEAIVGLGLDGRSVHNAVAVSPTTLLTPFFTEHGGRDAMPRARGGFAVEAADDDGETMVMAFLLDDREAAARLVAERRSDAETPRDQPWMVYGGRARGLEEWPRAKRLPGLNKRVVDAVRIVGRTTEGRPYTEAWVAAGRRLFVVLDAGHRLRPPDLSAAVSGLLHQLPARSGAELGLHTLEGWVSAVRRVDRASILEPSWQFLLHEASRGLQAGNDDACAEIFAGRLAASPDHARAAFECAAVPWDLALAETAAAELDRLPAAAVLRLVAHALDQNRPRLAARLLAKTEPEPELALQIAALRVATAVKLGRWSEVESVVERTPMLPAGLRAWAASAMLGAGREGPGTRILSAACPELSGDDRERCLRYLAP